jgi:hypothetical protein
MDENKSHHILTIPSKSVCENSSVPELETTKQDNPTKWITVPAKYSSAKVNTNNLSAAPTKNQQVVMWNRYTPLHNLKDSDEALNDRQSHHEQRRSQATQTS